MNATDPSAPPESVYFYTFHKCASTLFSGYVLKNIRGLHHLDFASRIYGGEPAETPAFQPAGYVYGPIRLSADPAGVVYRSLVAPLSDPGFVRDKLAVFWIRDPRDILVSSYYSFGFTHGFSPVPEIRARQEAARQEIVQFSVDEYALASASKVAGHFETLAALAGECRRGALLRYEDMIENFEYFVDQLSGCIPLAPEVIHEIFTRSRPKTTEDLSSHRRSGQVGGFRHKLKGETIQSLNRTLAPVLERFKYPPD